jgi:hypothetical protein
MSGLPDSVYRLLDFIDTHNPAYKDVPPDVHQARRIALHQDLVAPQPHPSFFRVGVKRTIPRFDDCIDNLQPHPSLGACVEVPEIYCGNLAVSLTKSGRAALALWRQRSADLAAAAAEDDPAFRPAKEFLDATRFKSYKALDGALRRNPWIRTDKASTQRRRLRAGDWHRYIAMLDAAGFDALDVSARTVEDFMAEARRRQEETRQRKAGK